MALAVWVLELLARRNRHLEWMGGAMACLDMACAQALDPILQRGPRGQTFRQIVAGLDEDRLEDVLGDLYELFRAGHAYHKYAERLMDHLQWLGRELETGRDG